MTNSVQFTPIVAIIVAIVVTMFDILWLARPLAEHQEEEGNAEYNPLENGQRINIASGDGNSSINTNISILY